MADTQPLVEVIVEDDRWHALDLGALAEHACRATLDHLDLRGPWEIALMACDDVKIACLNSDFRQKSAPTNVLSWPSVERRAERDGETPPPPAPSDTELGDIALAYETCLAEARASGKPFADHVSHLIVHGTLHLLGYDHVRGHDFDLMERTEIEILARMGLSDPYAATENRAER